MPYTLGQRTGGAAEVIYTFRAPASRAMLTSSREVVPRTIESSTSSTFLPRNSERMVLSFIRIVLRRCAWPGMMKVRAM